MTRRQKDPLRPLSDEECSLLDQIARSRSEPAAPVERAKLLLAVADGASYTAAAHSIGRRSNDAVSVLVSRFNHEGLAALAPRHGGGPPTHYGAAERERDGTATWSLSTLQQALRSAPDGLPHVSTFTIWCVLHEAGYRWQQSRSWCETGQVVRKRKEGVTVVSDPDTTPKKT